MSNLLPASVMYRRQSVAVYLNSAEDAAKLSRMLAPSGKLVIEQVFLAPAPNGLENPPTEGEEPTPQKSSRESKMSISTTSACRGIVFLPDEEHGSPGRGRALGFCPSCVKKIPRATRVEAFEQTKKLKDGASSVEAKE